MYAIEVSCTARTITIIVLDFNRYLYKLFTAITKIQY